MHGISSLFAQSEEEFYYDQARALLAQREIDEALVPLKKLYTAQPNNANFNFLIGAAYTELPGYHEEAVFHLKKAIQTVTSDYDVASHLEDASPFYSYYYLSVALVELDKCAEAAKSLEKFKSYETLIDKFYDREAGRHLEKCDYELYGDNTKDWDKVVPLPDNYNPIYVKEVEEIAAIKEEKEIQQNLESRGILTEKIEYTTNAPLWGVQIGSTNEVIPVNKFGNLKNIDAFVDKEGLIRYVMGHFSYRQQAESLLEVLHSKGFEDAFVVNVNDERKYSNSVISFNNVNIKSGLITGDVKYTVQLGAFEKEIPDELAKVYLDVDDLEEIKYGNLTLITSPIYSTFDEAKQKEIQLQEEGFEDAFVVAFNKGKKISLEDAKAATK